MLPGVSPAPFRSIISDPQVQCPAAGVKISENPKCQLRSGRNNKKETVKNPGNSGFFHRPFSVLHFLIVSSFVCAFLVPCGGRVQFLFNNNSNANNNVSMPCGGLISFLQPGKKEVFPMNMLCQCPTSGFSHFYTAFEIQISQLISVSMPYSGLLPFLRYSRGRCCDAYHFVSMPYIGLLPFLPGSAPVSSVSSLSLCQCPTSGFSHFYSTL